MGAGWEVCKERKWEQDWKYVKKGGNVERREKERIRRKEGKGVKGRIRRGRRGLKDIEGKEVMEGDRKLCLGLLGVGFRKDEKNKVFIFILRTVTLP